MLKNSFITENGENMYFFFLKKIRGGKGKDEENWQRIKQKHQKELIPDRF